ncbi:unnamed protein product [Brachionus calyciflorus]|uniref:Uncharacterized protein n=1 Tax=Brachionus calyciflorus TaxID=104777 RepID=A0A814HZL5_9BILA|nr:unnamed protein product [Brachionus calyciflorus]
MLSRINFEYLSFKYAFLRIILIVFLIGGLVSAYLVSDNEIVLRDTNTYDDRKDYITVSIAALVTSVILFIFNLLCLGNIDFLDVIPWKIILIIPDMILITFLTIASVNCGIAEYDLNKNFESFYDQFDYIKKGAFASAAVS